MNILKKKKILRLALALAASATTTTGMYLFFIPSLFSSSFSLLLIIK